MLRPLALIVLGVGVVFGGGAGSLSAAPQQTPKAVKGELIVGFAEGVSRNDQNAILKDAGATSKKRFGQIDAVLVKVKDDEEATVTKVLSSVPGVAYVEPNHVVSIAATPNDPSFSQLWGLHNTGQTGGTSDKDIDAPEAWDLATGDSSIVVAVTDTGVDFTHPDLASQRWVNPLDDPGDNIDDDGNGLVDDWSGWDFVNDDNDPFDDNRHGTHVSGTIGAAGNNGVGVVGVNWNVKIMALKFLSSAGSGSTADAVASTLYAADHGADVASNSWGGGPYAQALVDAIEYGASRGMLFVAAAGNDNRNNDVTPTYPATYGSDAVVAVAATDHNDARASFSSYGAKTVDLGAPGVGILSTTPGNTYQSFDGTSMATPHVAGAAALVEDRFPGATLYGIKALLMNSVDPNAALTGRTVTDGRLNIGNALSCADEPNLVLGAPTDGFVAGVGDVIPIRVLGSNCAVPAGVGNVTATVNGTTVALSAASPDSGLYTGSYTATVEQALTVTATVRIGGLTDTETVDGNAYLSYTCQDVPFSWVDATGVPPLSGADGDDTFSTLNIGFQFPFFGQGYGTAYVSSNGFLTLGSSAGATAFQNAAIPTTAVPNGVIAPFWDDLYPGASGSVHAGVAGSPGSRVLYVEWFHVPHFSLTGSGTATFEVAMYEATGEIRFQWLDTDFGNSLWNLGASATAGVERTDGVIGRQISFDQPLLTNGRAVSCAFGAPPPPPPPPPAPTVTTTSLPAGAVGAAYSATLQATGGTPPYAWSLDSGSLPSGLTLDTSTGAISGTPTSAGTSSFTAKVTDSATQSDAQALSIAVAPPPAPTVTTTSLPDGTVGVPYSQTLQATGGTPPYTWSLDAALPAGLSLDASTGAISGTPSSAGTSSFTATVTDNATQSDSQALSITVVVAPLAITTTTLPSGTIGVPYSTSLAASGGVSPYTWSRISGKLPNGLTLGSSGVISGTPTKRGTYTFTVRVTDSLGTQATRTFSIVISRP
jgi:subtilisin family serine protease